MPLFKTASTQIIDQPPDTGPVIHNHYAPGYTGLFVAAVFTAFGSLVLGWWFLVFLFDAAGFRHPQQMVSSVILVLGLAALVAWGLSNWVGGLLLTAQERAHSHQERMGKIQLDIQRYRAMSEVRELPSGRVNSEDQERIRFILAVMSKAYAREQPMKGLIRPWHRDQALEIAAKSLPPIKVTHTKAGALKSELIEMGIVTPGNQINLKDYPSLADVQQLFFKMYDVPVVVNRRAGIDIVPGSYEHIG